MNDLILRVFYDNAWNDLDIDSNIPLRLNISTVENTDIGQIFGVGSQTFSLPGTRNNNAFFKGAFKAGAVDIPAIYQSVDAEVLYNGETLLFGEMQLMEIITDEDGFTEYKVIIEDTVVQLKDALDGALIKDADFNAYNHTLNQTNLLNSWEGTLAGGDIFYPVADYGIDNKADYPTLPRLQLAGSGSLPQRATGSIDNPKYPLRLQQFLPAISARAVMDVIFDQAGFQYTSSLIDNNTTGSAFRDLFVLPKGQDELGAVVPESQNNTFDAEFNATQILSASTSGNPSPDQTEIINFDTEINDPGNNYNPTTFKYTAPANGNYTFNARIITNNPDVPSGGPGGDNLAVVRLRLIKDNGSSQTVFAEEGYNDPFLNMTIAGSTNLDTLDDVYVEIEEEQVNGAGSLNTLILSGSAPGQVSSFFNASSTPINYNNAPISMSAQFSPSLLSFDVLKSILTKFNAVAVPEPNTPNTIRIENYETFIAQGREIDWSQKYDNAKRIGIAHPVNEQSKELRIGDAEDDDRFSNIAQDDAPGYPYGTIRLISDSNIPNGTKEVQTKFGPLILGTVLASGSMDSDNNPTFNLAQGSNFVIPHLYKFDNNFNKSFKFKTRLGYKTPSLPAAGASGSVIYIGETPSPAQVSNYYTLANVNFLPALIPPSGSTSPISGSDVPVTDLNFDKNYFNLIPGMYNPSGSQSKTVYNSFWEEYIETLYWEDNRKVTMDIQFDPIDYKDIRLNDNIYVNGVRYRLNKINGFNLTQPDIATVELLKIRNLTGFEAEAPIVTPTPSPSVGTSPTPTPSISVSATPTPTPTPSVTPGESVTPTPTISVTPTLTPTPTISVTPGASVTPTPTISVTPTGTPVFTKIWLHAIEGSGAGSDTAACAGTTANAAYVDSSILDVADIQTGDIIYNNTGLTSPWNGGLAWYGASDIQGQVGADYAFLILANGTVNTISNCAASPTPTPTPTNSNPPFTNIEVRECGTSSPTYDIRVNGDYTSASNIGRALTISSGGGGGSCPTFNGTKCWEITAVAQGFYNCTATVSVTYSSCGGCTPASPTPTPSTSGGTPTPTPTISVTPTITPSTNYNEYTITNCGTAGGGYSDVRVSLGSGLGPGDVVLMPDGCYQIDDAPIGSSSNDYIASYDSCATCEAANPTPTPTPTISVTPTPTISVTPGVSVTPTPTISVTPSPAACIGIDVSIGSNATDGCCDILQTEYFNGATLAASTRHYTGLGCVTLSSGTQYISEDQSVYYEFFNGVKVAGPTTCPSCP